MEINARSADRNLLLEFSGELDHHGARDAAREVEQAIDVALPRKLVLDFAGVTFMDSSGIAVLLRTWRHVQEIGGRMLVTGAPDQARRVFQAAGLDKLIPFA